MKYIKLNNITIFKHNNIDSKNSIIFDGKQAEFSLKNEKEKIIINSYNEINIDSQYITKTNKLTGTPYYIHKIRINNKSKFFKHIDFFDNYNFYTIIGEDFMGNKKVYGYNNGLSLTTSINDSFFCFKNMKYCNETYKPLNIKQQLNN